jgi:hypothetical protein
MCHESGDHFLAMITSRSFLHCFPSVIGDIMNYALSPGFTHVPFLVLLK